MGNIIEASEELTEHVMPKEIVNNKLNKLILACRAEMEDNFQKDCPYCRGKNPQCGYFNSFFEDTAGPDPESKAQTEAASNQEEKLAPYLEEIRGVLAGQVISVKAGLIEYDLDLGANLSFAKRYLDLYSPYPELPFLSDLGNRLGFYSGLVEEAPKQGIQCLIPFPSILIRSGKIDFTEITEESRAEITNWFRAVLNDLDQGEAGELYLGLDLIPLDPADDVWGNIDPANSGEKQAYFAEILDIQSYLKLQKYIYQRLSDLEERMLIQPEAKKPEDGYPCSDLRRVHDELRRELTEIADAVREKVIKRS